MLTPEGRNQGIDPVSLFSGPAARARKWASEDLKQWWDANPRITCAEFEAQVTRKRTARRTRDAAQNAGNGRDFGV